MRIREVVSRTGLSKELIHHYLRHGLLPRSESRALYSAQQVRLLMQIRTLREDHNLPLEVIRELFERFDFDPDRIESLTLTESLCKRLTRFVGAGELLAAETLSEQQLAERAKITIDRLRNYVDARMVSPLGTGSDAQYSGYDAAVIALCEHGVALGIPFDSFRTISSYVRIAFDLEHAAFYGVERNLSAEGADPLASVFVRREVASGFVQNVLHATTQRRVRELLEQDLEHRTSTLDDVVYRPSQAFVRAHGIRARIDAQRDALRDSSTDRALWLDIARLLLHAGAYDEAAFFLEESLERFPNDTSLFRCAFGRALLLCGEDERGRDELAALGDDAHAAVFLALSIFKQANPAQSPDRLLAKGVRVLQLVNTALAGRTDRNNASDIEISTLAGWLMASLPPIYGCTEAGLSLLNETVDRLERDGPVDAALPGLRQRQQINAASVLLDCLLRRTNAADIDVRAEMLRALICRLDPASAAAEAAFLSDSSRAPRRKTP